MSGMLARVRLGLFLLSALLASGAAAPRDAAVETGYDLVIRNGRLIDGTGAPAVEGDLAIRSGRIVAIGVVEGSGRIEIDARGRVVAPGFLDVHTHAEDITELPFAENFIRMGVTTLVTGNCGSSKTDIGAFFESLRETGIVPNVATLVGHNSVRMEVMAGSFDRAPSAMELERMCTMVDRAMRDGAVGLSTGLIYPPGIFAKTGEIITLAKTAAAHGGIYASHLRHENYRILEALAELVDVARGAGIPAQVSHIKLSGPAAWGRAEEVLDFLDRARRDGIEVNQDQYVYTAASAGVGSRIPEDALEGGRERFRERLADPVRKAAIVADMRAALERSGQSDYGFVVIADFEPDRRINGKTIVDAAMMLRGSDTIGDQIETLLDLEARGGAQAVFHGIHEEDLRRFLSDPHTMIGSDSGIRRFGEGVPHPRGYGNHARVLGRYVRELKLLTIEEAVRRMTSLPARTFRIGDRGELRVGAFADVAIFDPQEVADPATFEEPHQYAIGFGDVIVNGVPVIRAGKRTGARPGVPVRRAGR